MRVDLLVCLLSLHVGWDWWEVGLEWCIWREIYPHMYILTHIYIYRYIPIAKVCGFINICQLHQINWSIILWHFSGLFFSPTQMASIKAIFAATVWATAAAAQHIPSGASSKYVAPSGFPTSVYSSYWVMPSAGAEPEVWDDLMEIWVFRLTLRSPSSLTLYWTSRMHPPRCSNLSTDSHSFPRNLTNPHTIPTNVTDDPYYFPSAIANVSSSGKHAIISSVVSQINHIISSTEFPTNCSRCVAGLSVAKTAALLAPEMVPNAMVALCKQYKLHSNATCEADFDVNTYGYTWTQVLAFADVSGSDGQYICNSYV